MKLLGWNCNGAFRRKYQALENFNADIWVVPESESPAYLLRHKSPLSSAQQLWCGQNQSKGLSVFAFNGCQISRADFFNPAYRHILPVNITTADKQKMLLIAVWLPGSKTTPIGTTSANYAILWNITDPCSRRKAFSSEISTLTCNGTAASKKNIITAVFWNSAILMVLPAYTTT